MLRITDLRDSYRATFTDNYVLILSQHARDIDSMLDYCWASVVAQQ